MVQKYGGKIKKMAQGGTPPIEPPINEKARIQRIMELSKKWGVPTNKILSQSKHGPKNYEGTSNLEYESFFYFNPDGSIGNSDRFYSEPVGFSPYTKEDIELQQKLPGKGLRVINSNGVSANNITSQGSLPITKMKKGGKVKKDTSDPTDPVAKLLKSAKTFKKFTPSESDNTPINNFGSDGLNEMLAQLRGNAQVDMSQEKSIMDSPKALKAKVKQLDPNQKKEELKKLNDLGYQGKDLADLMRQKQQRDSIVYQGQRVDASKANTIRSILPVPKNAAQMLTKRVLGESRMDENSLDDKEKLVLYNTIQNAAKRTGKNKGGTEYEDYSSEYGTAENFTDWFNKGKVDAVDLVGKSIHNPGFRVASTVGRGKYFIDPETGDVVYTDVYDWNTHEKDFKGESMYQNLRNNMRGSEEKDLTKDKNEKSRMNFILKKEDIDKLISTGLEDEKAPESQEMYFKQGGKIKKKLKVMDLGGISDIPEVDPNDPLELAKKRIADAFKLQNNSLTPNNANMNFNPNDTRYLQGREDGIGTFNINPNNSYDNTKRQEMDYLLAQQQAQDAEDTRSVNPLSITGGKKLGVTFQNKKKLQEAGIDPNDPKNNNQQKITDFPIGDGIKALAQGADYLATEFIDKPRKAANQAQLFRRQLMAVQSKPSQGGYDMPILSKFGTKVDRKPVFTQGVDNNFKVNDPNHANVLAEGGEFLQLPDGSTSNITGDKHSDYSGGELMSLPEDSKIYSDSIKVDKDFVKDLTGSKFKKKPTVAKLAKKYNTDHEEGILKDRTSDKISQRSANIMKTFKESQLQQIFDYQESVKDPMYMVNKEHSAQDYLGSQDQVVAKNGVKIMAKGGPGPKKKATGPLAPTGNLWRYYVKDGKIGKTNSDLPEQSTTVTVPRTANNPWYTQNFGIPQGGEIAPNPINLKGQMAMLEKPTSTPRKFIQPDSTPWKKLNLTVPELGDPLDINPPTLPTTSLITPTTVTPGTPIDPSTEKKPIPDNNKVQPPSKTGNPFTDAFEGLGELSPEILAMIQNQTDFPIFTSKIQPKYLNPVELNIQASLNENYAQTKPLLESTGNPSIDAARSAQATANLYDANNQVFQQKSNFDAQNRYQTDATNLQIENGANQMNLQRADDFWNKVTARQAVKEETNNNIANSAYSKFKKKQLENRSIQLTNQMFDNFKYDKEKGVYFDAKTGEQYLFHQPTGQFIGVGGIGDGLETTKTTRSGPKGTTQTIRQKEKRGL